MNIKLKILIDDKSYSSYTYHDAISFIQYTIPNSLDPLELKLFSGDIFNYDTDTGQIELSHSSIRTSKYLAGVIIMNKTFGRQSITKTATKTATKTVTKTVTKNQNNSKLLYRCIPDDKRLPDFLIPVASKESKFEKLNHNTYIIFTFQEWSQKHPIGQIKQTIGDVNVLVNYFEYQLYCKNLNISLKEFNDTTHEILRNSTNVDYIAEMMSRYKTIESRLDEEIFTIDPQSSQDYDDALSIQVINQDDNIIKVSVYISNVAILIDYFNLWNSFSERVATIYLPDRRRPMLPVNLSENLCSLKANMERMAICMDLYFENNILTKTRYKNVLIKVEKNYVYDEESLLKNDAYNLLLNETKKNCKTHKYMSNIKNSHDIVAYYMIFMNHEISKMMACYKNGIYRSVVEGTRQITIPVNLPEEIAKFLKIYHSMSGQYSDYENRKSHTYISNGVDIYLHITSPIRRLVDLLNLIKFQENLGEIQLSREAFKFYDIWVSRLEYINTTMRSIKRVQNNCTLLYMCINEPELIDKEFDGYVFDKIVKNDGLFQYNVYIPELKIMSKITIQETLEDYSNNKFKLFIFSDENNIKKKIRLKIKE